MDQQAWLCLLLSSIRDVELVGKSFSRAVWLAFEQARAQCQGLMDEFFDKTMFDFVAHQMLEEMKQHQQSGGGVESSSSGACGPHTFVPTATTEVFEAVEGTDAAGPSSPRS